MEARDKKVIDFVNMVGIANREQIREVFFPEVHQNICMRRLKKLADEEYISRFKYDGNVFVYYSDKKPSKRLIRHDLYITDFVVKMIKEGYEILEFKKSFIIGPIISDAYIKYLTKDGKERHLVLEVQLSNKVEDCVLKYKDFRNIILENKQEWITIPRIVVITDMKQRVELRGLKVLYDNTGLDNIGELL